MNLNRSTLYYQPVDEDPEDLDLLTLTIRYPENFFQNFSSKSIAIDLCFCVRSIVLDIVLPLIGSLTFIVLIVLVICNPLL